MIKIGDVVVYTDEVSVRHNALVTNVWSAMCINLVYMIGDENKTDPYGRQIERRTSCMVKMAGSAPGNFWEAIENKVE